MPPTNKKAAGSKTIRKGKNNKVENQLSELLNNRTLKIRLQPKSAASVNKDGRRNISGLEFTTTEDECILHGTLPIVSEDMEDVESTETILESEVLEIKDCYVKLDRSIECDMKLSTEVNEIEVTKEKETIATIPQSDSIGNKHRCKICSEYFEDKFASKFHEAIFHKEKDDLIRNQKFYLDEIRQLALASVTGETVESVHNKPCSPSETKIAKEKPHSATNTHINKRQICAICLKTFSFSSALYRHEREVHFGISRKRSNRASPKRDTADTSMKHPLKDMREAGFSKRTKGTASQRRRKTNIIVTPSIIRKQLKSSLKNNKNNRSKRSWGSLKQTTVKRLKNIQGCRNSIKQAKGRTYASIALGKRQ